MLHVIPCMCDITDGAIGILKQGTSSAASPDFFSSSLWGTVVGGFIAAGTAFLVSFITNHQQESRDKRSHEQQIKREQIAYERSLKDAKRERLNKSFKVILNAAEGYKSAAYQFTSVMQSETLEARNQRINSSLNKELLGVNQAMIEITLENVGADIETHFGKVQQAYIAYIRNEGLNGQVHNSLSPKELDEKKKTLAQKVIDLTAFMQKHIKELES